jgi:hypothetical protein
MLIMLGWVRQEDREFEASVDYTVRPCLKKPKKSQAPVAHAYNPSYLGG